MNSWTNEQVEDICHRIGFPHHKKEALLSELLVAYGYVPAYDEVIDDYHAFYLEVVYDPVTADPSIKVDKT